jgi:putative quorum-sensing-regulated virulence factor
MKLKMEKPKNNPSPKMTVGKYAGIAVDKLPSSYVRWIISQDFPKDILEAAKRKLEDSEYNDIFLHVSRHAIDMYSLRFLEVWKREAPEMGLGSFVAKRAQEAWISGVDVSKYRHQDDGIVKEWRGIKWVFGVNPNFPEYQDVITVMSSTDEQLNSYPLLSS